MFRLNSLFFQHNTAIRLSEIQETHPAPMAVGFVQQHLPNMLEKTFTIPGLIQNEPEKLLRLFLNNNESQ